LIPSPRSLAVDLLDRIDRTGAFAEPLLDACLRRHALANAADRHLLTSLVYGTLRMRGHLDWIIERLYKGTFASMQDGIKNILRTALYQFLFMERIPILPWSMKLSSDRTATRPGTSVKPLLKTPCAG
jgi:16S rRNA (cytosine967-C5)-methyltransferase